tara:strand:- start:91 stop:291 length:201 start_codon:yes stop_codon:yes gene_type:complete
VGFIYILKRKEKMTDKSNLELLKEWELIEIITDQTEKIEKIGELVRVAEQKQGRTTIDINKLNKIL